MDLLCGAEGAGAGLTQTAYSQDYGVGPMLRGPVGQTTHPQAARQHNSCEALRTGRGTAHAYLGAGREIISDVDSSE